ncbi:MAG: hypothetical protein NT023_20060 [Armatimonadetes bacterium]|nr:hypothetical protein [Armatimonadota bacterium]
MLKILELHPSVSPHSEYVVLENQGLVTVNLKGYALCSEAFLMGDKGQLADEMYVFRDEIPVKPFQRVVLFTGSGENCWLPTIDGKQAYCAYWNRSSGMWNRAGELLVLHIAASRRIGVTQALAVSV